MGLNVGGNWGTSNATTNVVPGTYLGGCPTCVANIVATGNQSIDTSGFTGGMQGGYNWQSGNLVAGIEFDFEYFRSAGSKSVAGPFTGGGTTATVSSSMSTDWLFTARPRLGVAATNWLFYGTGGLAVTKLKANWSYSDTLNPGLTTESASATRTKAGWVVGGGVEAALPGNWLIGGEYLYVKFNSVTEAGKINLVTDVLNHSADLASSIVRARISKKF